MRGVKPAGTSVATRPDGVAGDVVEMGAPEELSESGRAVWRTLMPDLIAAKTFRISDALLLVELCESMAMAREFRLEVVAWQSKMRQLGNPQSAGEIEEATAVSHAIRRARTGYREMMQTVMSIAGEFGISPVARIRLGLMKMDDAGGLRGEYE